MVHGEWNCSLWSGQSWKYFPWAENLKQAWGGHRGNLLVLWKRIPVQPPALTSCSCKEAPASLSEASKIQTNETVCPGDFWGLSQFWHWNAVRGFYKIKCLSHPLTLFFSRPPAPGLCYVLAKMGFTDVSSLFAIFVLFSSFLFVLTALSGVGRVKPGVC